MLSTRSHLPTPADAGEVEPCRLPGSGSQQLCGWGRGAGPRRVLLLHGLGDHARVWEGVERALAPFARTLAVDLRGHGDSDWAAEGDYSRAAFASDLEAVIQHLDEPQVVLVGHSLGGSLALAYAARHPSRVSALVLIDLAPRLERSAAGRLVGGLESQATPFESFEDYHAHLRERYWLAQPEALEAFARLGVRVTPEGAVAAKVDPRVARVLEDREAPGDTWDELRRVRCPTLVVRAQGSAVLSRALARQMVDEGLERGWLEEIPRAGHAVLLDNPPEVARRVADFLR